MHPAYFPSIATFSVIVQQNVVWEAQDHFQKQTYRNRCYICTDQGKHRLNLPVKHMGGKAKRQKYSDVVLDDPSRWKRLHWRALETAYRASPYFEFYEDELKPLFKGDENNLYAFNLKILETLGHCLGFQMPQQKTETFEKCPSQYIDARFLIDAKKRSITLTEPYTQVFGERHGFVANLSILDLLFNEGPNTVSYLKRQSLDALLRS